MIRKAKLEDIPALCEISEQPGLRSAENTGDYSEWYYDLIHHKNGIALVYESDDIILGGVIGETLISDGSILWMLGVVPEKHGSIIGVRLLTAYEKECAKRGITWIYTDGYVETVNMDKMNKLGYATNNSKYVGYVKNLTICYCKDNIDCCN